jgi:hypothetical protein
MNVSLCKYLLMRIEAARQANIWRELLPAEEPREWQVVPYCGQNPFALPLPERGAMEIEFFEFFE